MSKKFLSEIEREEFIYDDSIDPDILSRDFFDKFQKIYSRHAPVKSKKLRGNNANFMTKNLSKAIMTRSRLRRKFNKNKSEENWENFRKQRNKCTAIKMRCKTEFFEKELTNPNPQKRKFWQIVKPYVSDKGHHNNESFMLLENDTIIKNEDSIASIFN